MKSNLSVANNEHTLQCLGKLLDVNDPSIVRDAVHIAVIPVVASEKLYPNDDIELNAELRAKRAGSTAIGKVDPLLTAPVMPGQCFFLWVYPGTIKSLHHHWTHASIPNEFNVAVPALAVADTSTAEAMAVAWITDYARDSCDGISYHDLMEAARDYDENGEYMIQGGRFEGVYCNDAFWDHYEIVTGKKVTDRGGVFSCSC